MTTLHITVDRQAEGFLPGESLSGHVRWDVDGALAALEIRLFWYTAGKGTQDVGIVATERLDAPRPSGGRPFRFTLPRTPFSFSGTLISLVWAIELVALPGAETQRVEFVVSPTRAEVFLPREAAAP